MALNVPLKLPHPIAVALMERYGEDFFLKATELNDIVEAIKGLELREDESPEMEWEIDNWS
jgi:hypothetical protein